MMTDHSQAESIPGFHLITTAKADAPLAVVDGFTAIIAVRVRQLMGKHQIFSDFEPVKFSFIFHSLTTRISVLPVFHCLSAVCKHARDLVFKITVANS